MDDGEDDGLLERELLVEKMTDLPVTDENEDQAGDSGKDDKM